MKKIFLALLATSSFMIGNLYGMFPSNLEEAQKMLVEEGGELQEAGWKLLQALGTLMSTVASESDSEKEEAEESAVEESEEAALTTVDIGNFISKLNEIQKAGVNFVEAAKQAKKVAQKVKGDTWQEGIVEEPAQTKEDDEFTVVEQPDEEYEKEDKEEDDFLLLMDEWEEETPDEESAESQ